MSASRLVRSGDVPISVTDWGGDGPPTLFVHATGFCAGVWNAVVAAMGQGRRCFGFDQRGHGLSGKPFDPDAYAWEFYADDTLAVLDAMGVDRVDAVGHSSGAAAIVLAATREPQRFGRVVLVEPIIPPPVPPEAREPSPLAEGARRRRMIFESCDDMLARFASKPPMDSWSPEVLHDYVEHGSFTRPDGLRELLCPGEMEAFMYEQGGGHRGYDALPEVMSPALVLCGERSQMPLDWWRHVAGRIPHHEFRVLNGCGHFAPMEEPGTIASAARAFFAPEDA